MTTKQAWVAGKTSLSTGGNLVQDQAHMGKRGVFCWSIHHWTKKDVSNWTISKKYHFQFYDSIIIDKLYLLLDCNTLLEASGELQKTPKTFYSDLSLGHFDTWTRDTSMTTPTPGSQLPVTSEECCWAQFHPAIAHFGALVFLRCSQSTNSDSWDLFPTVHFSCCRWCQSDPTVIATHVTDIITQRIITR